MPRIIVAIELANGGRAQAVCRTPGCTAGPGGTCWRGTVHVVKVAAQDEACHHRQWHRARHTVPVEVGQ